MSAALLLNPLLGAAPADPARLPSSEGAGFADVLANATAAASDGEPASAPGRLAPATTPAAAVVAASGLVPGLVPGLAVVAAGKGLANGLDLKGSGAVRAVEDGRAQGSAVAAIPDAPAAATGSVTLTPLAAPLSPGDEPAGAAAAGEEAPATPDALPTVAAAPVVPPAPAGALQATASSTPVIERAAALRPLPAGVAAPEAPASGAAPVGLAVPVAPISPDSGTEAPATPDPAVTSAATTATPLRGLAAAAPAEGAPVTGRPAPAGTVPGAPSLAPTPANAAALPGAVGVSGSGLAGEVSAGPAKASAGPVVEVASSTPAVAPLTDQDAPAAATAAAAATASVAEPRTASSPTGTVPTTLIAAAATLAPRPSARRPDAPISAELTRPAAALATALAPETGNLSAEVDAAAPILSDNDGAGANSPSGATASAAGGPTPTTPTVTASASASMTSAAPPTGEAALAPVLTGTDAELSPLDVPVDMPAGETPPLPETPLPTASAIVLQPLANDGRFNALAQISAQILRRLESQTTRFELALTPEDLGRVDVMLEIDGDGSVTARLAFDNPAAAAELRAQADQLRRELEAAGLNVARDGLQFAERDARRDDSGTDRRGARAFAGAARLESDADAGVAAYRVSLADGRLDVRI